PAASTESASPSASAATTVTATARIHRQIPRGRLWSRCRCRRGSATTAAAAAAAATRRNRSRTGDRLETKVPAHRLNPGLTAIPRNRQLAYLLTESVGDAKLEIGDRFFQVELDNGIVRRILADPVLVSPELIVLVVLVPPL